MKVTGWNNGSWKSTGAGYGVRIKPADRRYFSQTSVQVNLPNGQSAIVTSPKTRSFWNKCPQLRSKMIGRWMINARFAPWPRGNPPQFDLIPSGQNRFRLTP